MAALAQRLQEKDRQARNKDRRLLLSNPLGVPLPTLPRVRGDRETFLRAVRTQLEDLRAHWPLYRSLLTPVKITFLVVPPEQGKDLDNIALMILPIAHQVLEPHIEPHLLAPALGDTQSTPWREEALRRLRSLNAQSVAAYQVIELPRSEEDPPGGLLRLAIGSNASGSWWQEATDYMEHRLNGAAGTR